MSYKFIVDKIPTPTLTINYLTKEVYTNTSFVDLVGYAVNTIDQLSMIGITGVDFNIPLTKKEEFDTSIFNNKNEKIVIKLKCNQLSETESICTIEQQQTTLEAFFCSPVTQHLFDDLQIGLLFRNVTTNSNIWISTTVQNKSGFSIDEINQKNWQELTYPEDIEIQKNAYNSVLQKQKKSYCIEKRMITKSGKVIWIEEFGQTYTINNQIFLLILLRDKSSEKENEIELTRAKQKVEEAEKLKSAFLDNMPHEIRTPLHAITGFTSLLSDVDLTTKERLEYVKFIQDSSNVILNIIDNIIEIAKLETNQIKAKREKCFVNSVMDQVYREFKSRQQCMDKAAVEIRMIKPNADPTYMIYSDAERLFQIFSHLLNNALKFTDVGFIEFGYHLPVNNHIEFYVKDTGIGIPKDHQNLIFQKFGKSGNINTDKNRGTGLGLTLSKKLVELLNGEIKLASEIGNGSTFLFSIPIENAPKITISRPSVYGELNWNSKTILVAEDTESNYFFIEAFLERTNVNLLWAQDGREAIDLFRENGENINLILMDIMMPEIDGFDATIEIKKMDPTIPIIAQTALALPDDEERCYEVGCDYVLIKPINSEDLIASIKRFIR